MGLADPVPSVSPGTWPGLEVSSQGSIGLWRLVLQQCGRETRQFPTRRSSAGHILRLGLQGKTKGLATLHLGRCVFGPSGPSGPSGSRAWRGGAGKPWGSSAGPESTERPRVPQPRGLRARSSPDGAGQGSPGPAVRSWGGPEGCARLLPATAHLGGLRPLAGRAGLEPNRGGRGSRVMPRSPRAVLLRDLVLEYWAPRLPDRPGRRFVGRSQYVAQRSLPVGRAGAGAVGPRLGRAAAL